MTPNPPVAAPVEERHIEAAEQVCMSRVEIPYIAQLLANTEAAARADERQKAMETACRAVCNAPVRGCERQYPRMDRPNSCTPEDACKHHQELMDAIRRAFEEKGGGK